MKLAIVAKSAWKDLPQRVAALAKTLSSKLPEPVEIDVILKDYGAIPADKDGRITAAFLDKTLALDCYDGACLLVSLSDRKKYALKPTLRGHYHRDEDGYVEFWVASDRTTRRKGKPQFEETFTHELCHALYHWLGVPKTTDETRRIVGRDNTHWAHDVAGDLGLALAEIRAAWPKKKTAPKDPAKADLTGYDPRFIEWYGRMRRAMAELRKPMFAFEARRSNGRQLELWKQGRNAAGEVVDLSKVVTWAKPGESLHNTGRAIDLIFEGTHWSNPDADWALAGMMGKSLAIAMGLKLTWGGDWAGKKNDRPHWELA